MKILVIEDDHWFAESLATTIHQADKQTQVKIVDDGHNAMQVIDEWKPDLLILDMMLGLQNGLSLLNELQSYSDTRIIPVVVMSVDTKRLEIDDLRQFGVLKIINKADITSEILAEVISDV